MEQPKTFEEVWDETFHKLVPQQHLNAMKMAFFLGERSGILSAALTVVNVLVGKRKLAEVTDATL